MATSIEHPAHPSGVHGIREEGPTVTSPAVQHTSDAKDASSNSSPTNLSPPPAPNPSEDTNLIPKIVSPPPIDTHPSEIFLGGEDGAVDLAKVRPEAVMKLLAYTVSTLATSTGDIPATPAAQTFSSTGLLDSPRASGKENVIQERDVRSFSGDSKLGHSRTASRPETPTPVPDHDLKGLHPVSLSSPEANPHESPVPFVPTPPLSEDALQKTLSAPEQERKKISTHREAQAHAIARKFFSKSIPPITIEVYLARMQRYCPMSTAVWLAAAYYLSRLTLPNTELFGDRSQAIVPLTPRTMHRLILAALRVAMKALEDLRYPQARFAGVGGVSEVELKSLEISLCYLMDFELQADGDRLVKGVISLQRASAAVERTRFSISGASGGGFQLMKESLVLRMRHKGGEG